ncbi:hypothetical protein PUN28_003562 [Cardiocondyla obscurior]|uniref:Uncharacterized protein n=1 Tax=Cardiocondyla obscurior TaxID=286306 RepID=A0AAW2GP17_9HYME
MSFAFKIGSTPSFLPPSMPYRKDVKLISEYIFNLMQAKPTYILPICKLCSHAEESVTSFSYCYQDASSPLTVKFRTEVCDNCELTHRSVAWKPGEPSFMKYDK